MSDPLKFEFRLLDLMSAPAATIAKTLTAANVAMKNAKPAGDALTVAELKNAIAAAKDATETRRLAIELAGYTKQLLPAEKDTKALTTEMGNMIKSFAGFRQNAEGGWILNVAEGFEHVLGVVGRISGALVDVATNALKVGAAGEKTKTAFNLNLGDKAGQEVTDYIANVAKASRGLYTIKELSEGVLPLARSGIGIGQIDKMVAASQSIEARGGNVNEALAAFGSLTNDRHLDVGTLKSLGFGNSKEQLKIAHSLGGIGATPEAALGIVQQQLSLPGGDKLAQRAYITLLNRLQRREKRGKLGADAVDNFDSPAANLKRVQNSGQTISERIAAGGSFNELYKALNNFTQVLTGPAGKGLIDALGGFVSGVAKLVNLYAEFISTDKPTTDTDRARGILGATDLGGGKRIQYDQQDIDAALTRHGKGGAIQKFLQPEADRTRQGLAYIEADRKAGLTPAVSKEIGDNIATGLFDKQRALEEQKRLGAPAALKGKADDFIWRDGAAIQINPNDTVVGYKRGGSLGAGEGGGGSGYVLNVHPGAIQIDGSGLNAGEIADEVINRLEKAPGQLLLSAFNQMQAENG